jgi:ATP-dependent Lhr-like helicase
VEPDLTRRAHALTQVLLDRHGVVTKAIAGVEELTASAEVPGGIPFSMIYQVLKQLEERGRVKRGYFVEGLGGAQFALPGAVDLLRADAAEQTRLAAALISDDAVNPTSRAVNLDLAKTAVLLAATDPANPYGAALPWPLPHSSDPTGQLRAAEITKTSGQVINPSATTTSTSATSVLLGDAPGSLTSITSTGRPRRTAGATVVLVNGKLVAYLERGGRSLLTFNDEALLPMAVKAVTAAALSGRLGKLTITKINGQSALQAAGQKTPVTQELLAAGFTLTPSGLRLR